MMFKRRQVLILLATLAVVGYFVWEMSVSSPLVSDTLMVFKVTNDGSSVVGSGSSQQGIKGKLRDIAGKPEPKTGGHQTADENEDEDKDKDRESTASENGGEEVNGGDGDGKLRGAVNDVFHGLEDQKKGYDDIELVRGDVASPPSSPSKGSKSSSLTSPPPPVKLLAPTKKKEPWGSEVADDQDHVSHDGTDDDEDEGKDGEEVQDAVGAPSPESQAWEARKMVVPKDVVQLALSVVALSSTLSDCAFPPKMRKDCPTMMACKGSLSLLHYCRNNFTDPLDKVVQTVHYKVLGANHTANLGYPASEGHIFSADGVYVNHKGDVFTDELFFFHGGCKGQGKFTLPMGREIGVYKGAINLSHLWGHNFYHLMGEILPRTFQVRDLMLKNPDLPIILKKGTNMSKIFQLLLLDQPKVIVLEENETVFLEHVYFPLKVKCGKSPHTVWREFRTFFFENTVKAIVRQPRPRKVTDLKIVLAKRLHSRRIEGFDDLVKELQLKYGDRVVVFNGNEGLEGSVKIFSDAAIYVASHGAGLTNMVYMPDNGVVVEILPDQYHNHCFGHMASALPLEYHMILGKGKKRTAVTVDLLEVVEKVGELAKRFHH